jgi:low affinity Fe/Cu permease
MNEAFRKFSTKVADMAGSFTTFALALAVILVWAVTGPVFGFSDTWQLIINTGTTIVTFLMVFLIQNTQNRDNSALHAKLDELIVHTQGAHNEMTTAEDFSEEELRTLKEHFIRVADQGGTNSIGERLPRDIQSKSKASNGSGGNGRARTRSSARRGSSSDSTRTRRPSGSKTG